MMPMASPMKICWVRWMPRRGLAARASAIQKESSGHTGLALGRGILSHGRPGASPEPVEGRAAGPELVEGLLDKAHGALLHAVPLYGSDVDLQAAVAHAVSDPRRPAQQHEDEAADAVHLLVLQVEIELLSYLVDPHRARDAEAPGTVAINRFVGRRPFFDVPDDLFEEILERHDAGRAPVLVDHDHHLRPLPANGGKHRVERRALWHERQGPRVGRADGLVTEQHTQQILYVDHAHDVIEVAFDDRIPCVRRAREDLAD